MHREKLLDERKGNTMDYKNKAERIIYDCLINPYLVKTPQYIGTELELPVIATKDAKGSHKVVIDGLLRYMISNCGFTRESVGSDGFIVRISNGIDALSCDYSYQIFEFSMGKDICINKIEQRFSKLYKTVKDYLNGHGFIITGMGTHHFGLDFADDSQYTHDLFYSAVRRFILDNTQQHDPSRYYTEMASAQSHIEVDGTRIIDAMNLEIKLDFIRALLFSNSLPNKSVQNYLDYPDSTICIRDYLWRQQYLPNVDPQNHLYSNLEDLICHIRNLKLFCETDDDGHLVVFNPITLNDYFADDAKIEKGLSCFRSFEHVVLNNHATLEIRDDCMQPVNNAFVPLAFNLGVLNNIDRVSHVVDLFLSEINMFDFAVLREKAVTRQEIAPREQISELLMSVVDCAKEGLMLRGYGEEQYLKCLYDRIKVMMSPAEYTLSELKAGRTMLDVAMEFSYQ